MEPDDMFTELHPETPAIMTALVVPDEPLLAPSVDEEALSRFVCGWATEGERDEVVGALTRSVPLRARLLELREALRLSEQGVADREVAFAREPVLAETVRQALTSSLRVYGRWHEACQAAFRRASENLAEQRATVSTLSRISDRMARQPRLAFSAMRGAGNAARVRIEPTDEFAELKLALIDGDLEIEAHGEKSTDASTELSVYFEGEGDWIYVGRAVGEEGRWRLIVPRFEGVTGPGGSAFTADAIRLVAGRRPRSFEIPIEGPSVSDALFASISRGPIVHNGEFSMGLHLPLGISKGTKEIVVSLEFGSSTYVLGSIDLTALDLVEPVEFKAHIGVLPQGPIELLSPIRLTLR